MFLILTIILGVLGIALLYPLASLLFHLYIWTVSDTSWLVVPITEARTFSSLLFLLLAGISLLFAHTAYECYERFEANHETD